MTVNAAPYALGFYHKLGFWDLAPQQKKEGIIYTSMKRNLQSYMKKSIWQNVQKRKKYLWNYSIVKIPNVMYTYNSC